jgi:transposase
VNIREVLNGIFYVLWTGCQWKALPKDFPPKSTVHWYLMLWEWDGTLERLHHTLYVAVREQEGREASPTAAIIDSQSAKTAQKGGSMDPQGYDAGKKVTGRKRHILVDTLGLLLSVAVHPANIQDRDGAALVLDEKTRALWPFIVKIFADAGYQGARAAQAAAASTGSWMIEIVKRTELHKFAVLPQRWIVERTLAWISRNRRLMRDYERYARTVAAFIRLAMIRLMLRRLTRSTACT